MNALDTGIQGLDEAMDAAPVAECLSPSQQHCSGYAPYLCKQSKRVQRS